MARGMLFYVLMWIFVAILITVFRHLSKKEKWTLAKVSAYAALYAAVALIIVLLIVVLF